jgi:hypothetical protein
VDAAAGAGEGVVGGGAVVSGVVVVVVGGGVVATAVVSVNCTVPLIASPSPETTR